MAEKKPLNNFDWRTAVRAGLISGAVLVLVSAIGMVETFNERSIVGNLITMGQSVLLGLLFVLSYGAANRASGGNKLFSVFAGALSGLVGSATLAAFVWFTQIVDVHGVLVNVTPALIRILTFGKDLPTQLTAGLFLILSYGIVIGALAGLLSALPVKMRKAISTGLVWVAVLGLLGELIRTILTGRPLIDKVDWMLGSRIEKGLSQIGALTIFLVVSALSYLSQHFGGGLRTRLNARRQSLPVRGQRALNAILLFLAFALLWQLPSALGLYLSEVANNISLYIMMGLGLNIVVGFAGLLDLGYVAFFAIGAYTMGVATSTGVGTESGQIVFSLGLTFWQALPLAVAAAILAGVVLGVPVLKMRGDYLAIVTLGFGEIVRILTLSDMLKPYIGGAQGIVGVAPILISGQNFSKPIQLFHIVLVGCVLVAFIAWRLRDSRVGRAWKAVREDEDVAQAMGINLVLTKLMAFATGAAFSGLAGAIFASKLTSFQPGSFTLLVSINILSLIIIGGMGSIPGVVVGALALVGLPELLREFAEFRLLVFGAALVMMMLVRPEGLLPEETHRRELREEENASAEPTATA
jgi:branched-chain amino acid transport system permease protein